jgi:hypothetical protein
MECMINNFIEDIPLCLISYKINKYKINKMFLVAVKHNNIFSFPHFDGDMFRFFRPPYGHFAET